MKKHFICSILILIIFKCIDAQNAPPKFILPIMNKSSEFDKTFYTENKEYTCEEWLETYMQLYHSNRTKELEIIKPSDKYAVVKYNSQNDREAKFIFDIYNTKIFIENTPTSIVEMLLEDNPDYSKIDNYSIDKELLITGIMIPYNFEMGSLITITPANPELLFTFVEKVEFISSRNGGGNGGNQNLVGLLTGNNPSTFISPAQLSSVEIKVLLKNGRRYNYLYKHDLCNVDPIDLEPPTSTTPPPNPTSDPPIIPELDEECSIKPTYLNNPITGLKYKAQISFNDFSTGTTLEYFEIVGYINDSQNNTYKPVWGKVEVFVPNSYTTSVNKAVYNEFGEVTTSVYLNPYHNKVTKPIIITDGIDFLSNRTLKDIIEHFGGNEMISLIWDGGYDLIIADFAGGADFMQRNSYALIELIRSLRHEQQVEEIEAIIGPSMGGQIIRHALLYWEKNLQSDPSYADHNIKMFVSADSPWTGANASPAVQGLARYNKEGSTTMMEIDQSANSPAACQLLLNQIDGSSPFGGVTYAPAEHAFKTSFDAEITLLGSIPQSVEKLLAIADGSGNGTTSNVVPGDLILGIDYETCNDWYLSECEFTTEMNAVNNIDVLVDKKCETTFGLGFSCDEACSRFPFFNTPVTNRIYDSSPASPFNLAQYFKGLKPGMPIFQDGGFNVKLKEIREGGSFAFIPTFSALGMSTSTVGQDFTQSVINTPYGYILPGSPFDHVYFDNTDSKHNSFTPDAQEGSLPFLLSNLEYQKIYNTKCLVDENIIAPSELFSIEQGGQGSEQSFCIPFKYESYYVKGENDCEISLIAVDGNNSYYLQSNLYDQWCSDEVEICFKTECGDKCIKVKVETYPAVNRLTNSNNDVQNSKEFKILPNPSNGTFEIIEDINNYNVEIRNILGQKLKYSLNGNTIILDDQFNSGVIFINLINEKNFKLESSTKMLLSK